MARLRRIKAGAGALFLLSVLMAVGDPVEVCAAAAENGAAWRSPQAPVLVELFTSEGCSSCPPADAMLMTLASAQPVPGAEVIALEEHVDYWNRLGWTDPYSSRAFSLRQEEYGEAFGNGRIYTPQMIVDGRAEFVGSDLARARRAVARAMREPKVPVGLFGTPGALAGDLLTIRIECGPYDADMDAPELWVAVTEDGLATEVLGGENAGKKLRHGAVTRSLQRIAVRGPRLAGEVSVHIDEAWGRERIRIVAFVQDRDSRRVLGAVAKPLEALLSRDSQSAAADLKEARRIGPAR